MVRAYVIPTLENIALWHERDISHSSVERIIYPDACILMHYMLNRMNTVLKGLVVYPENMLRNLNRFGGIVFSQRVLLELVQKGVSREEAYRIVQRNAHAAWNTEHGSFQQNLLTDLHVLSKLTKEELLNCFSTDDYLKHVDLIFSRFGL
jgi:adenylosuccinate lyase